MVKIIKVFPNQIPLIWESMKTSAVKTNLISKDNLSAHCNLLLINLLSSKSQCFAILEDIHTLKCIALTRYSIDPITGNRILVIDSLFSLSFMEDADWQDSIEYIKKYAKANNCVSIEAKTQNDRMFEIAKGLGFTQVSKNISLTL
jgi:hypothetical protein